MTHIIIPENENNTCDVNLECLTGIANGLFIVNQNCKFFLIIIIIVIILNLK